MSYVAWVQYETKNKTTCFLRSFHTAVAAPHAKLKVDKLSRLQRRTSTEAVVTLEPSCSRGWKAKAQSATELLPHVSPIQKKLM